MFRAGCTVARRVAQGYYSFRLAPGQLDLLDDTVGAGAQAVAVADAARACGR